MTDGPMTDAGKRPKIAKRKGHFGKGHFGERHRKGTLDIEDIIRSVIGS